MVGAYSNSPYAAIYRFLEFERGPTVRNCLIVLLLRETQRIGSKRQRRVTSDSARVRPRGRGGREVDGRLTTFQIWKHQSSAPQVQLRVLLVAWRILTTNLTSHCAENHVRLRVPYTSLRVTHLPESLSFPAHRFRLNRLRKAFKHCSRRGKDYSRPSPQDA